MVSTPTIRSRILKVSISFAFRLVWWGFNPNDPFEDTESKVERGAFLGDDEVSTPTIRSRILKGIKKETKSKAN